MGAVVILVVGLGWYTNFRIYKRDLEDIKRDVMSIKQTALSSLRDEMLEAVRATTKNEFKEVRRMRYDLLKSEAEQHEAKAFKRSFLGASIKMVNTAIEIGSDHYISEALDFLKRDIKLGGVDYPPTVVDITQMIDSLPNQHAIEVDNIRKALRAARE
jgi:hypothetical protein